MAPLLLLTLLARDPATPEGALVSATDGRATVWVDAGAGLWLGSKKIADLKTIPTGLALADDVVVWTSAREGLLTRSQLSIYTRRGELLREAKVDAPIQVVLPTEDGAAVGLPGSVWIVPSGKDKPRDVPLPMLSTVDLTLEGGHLQLLADGGKLYKLDPKTGCPDPLPVETEPLLALRAAETAARCGAKPALSPAQREAGEAARGAAIQGAILARSSSLLAALGVRGEGDLTEWAPRPAAPAGLFRTKSDATVSLSRALLGSKGAVLVQDPDADLEGYTGSALAPACAAKILLVSPTLARQARWKQALSARAGETCLDQVQVLPVGLGLDPDETTSIRYVSPSGSLLAARDGAAVPAQIRLDIASLTPSGDPLTSWSVLPNLTYSWIVASGPVHELLLDRQSRWIAAAGWELIRGEPRALALFRQPLTGPVEGLGLRPNGLVDAVVGGQKVVVDLDTRDVRWFDPGPASPAPIARDAGPWRVDGRTLRRAARGALPSVALSFPVAIQAVAAAGPGAVVETPLGLFGVNSLGKPSWRLTAARGWTVIGTELIAGLPQGVTGYTLVDQTE